MSSLDSLRNQINLTHMKKTSKTITDRHHIVQLLEKEYESSVRLLKLVFEKIKGSTMGMEPTIEVLLVRKEISFYPNANIVEVLRILRYEGDFEAFIKLNHSYSCDCRNCDPPCCRWITVKNTWAFPNKSSVEQAVLDEYKKL